MLASYWYSKLWDENITNPQHTIPSMPRGVHWQDW
jgi:hypothetical protein